jgi:hypothetical protein
LDSFFQNIRALQKSKPKRRKRKKQNTQVQIIKIESGSVTFILRVSDRCEAFKNQKLEIKNKQTNKAQQKRKKKNFKQEEED